MIFVKILAYVSKFKANYHVPMSLVYREKGLLAVFSCLKISERISMNIKTHVIVELNGNAAAKRVI